MRYHSSCIGNNVLVLAARSITPEGKTHLEENRANAEAILNALEASWRTNGAGARSICRRGRFGRRCFR
jgi:hypothetical protein